MSDKRNDLIGNLLFNLTGMRVTIGGDEESLISILEIAINNVAAIKNREEQYYKSKEFRFINKLQSLMEKYINE